MLVSIIIPAYNAEAYLSRAVDSALAAGARVQGEWEVILVDNRSTDRTLEIINEYASRWPLRITVGSTDRQGAGHARNEGLRLASGTWIQFLDADDYIDDDKISGQLERVTATTEWVVGGYRECAVDGSYTDVLPHEDPWKGLVYGYRIGHTDANLYRNATLARVGNWNPDVAFHDDPELHFRLLAAEAVYVLDPRVSSYYVQHDGPRITNGPKKIQAAQALDLLSTVVDTLSRERPDYLLRNHAYFYGALLRGIRILATYDLPAATRAYRTYFKQPGNKVPGPPYQFAPYYSRLYPYLGFRNIEWVRRQLSKVLPAGLKQTLKA